MTENELIVRSSMNDLIQKEKESNLFRTKMANILKTPMSQEMREHYNGAGIPISNGTLTDAISASMIIQAMAGNVNAYTVIRDTMGYKPVEQVRNDVVIRVDMTPKARELGE